MPHDFINEAQQVIMRGQRNLTDVLPEIIARILRDDLWKQRTDKEGKPFSSFRAFVEHKLWWGLECHYDRLVKYCEHHLECRALLLDQVEPETAHGYGPGRGNKRDYNVSSLSEPKHGNRSTYLISRLKRDAQSSPTAAELLERIKSGELSAHKAAVEAGIVKPNVIVSRDPEKTAKAILDRFGSDYASALQEAIQRSLNEHRKVIENLAHR